MWLKLFKASIFAVFFLIVSSHSFAHDGATGIIKDRMVFMSSLGKIMKSLSKIVKGRIEFDPNKVRELTSQLKKHSGSNLTQLFPDGSLDIPTAATAEIWKDWDTFRTHAQDLSRTAAELAEITRYTSMKPSKRTEAMAMVYKRIARTCSACHQGFRKKKN